MPELPEVQTTINGLRKKVLERIFFDVETDISQKIRCFVGGRNKGFPEFKKQIRHKRVKAVRRAGKNIILDLSQGWSLLIHQKMTGHLLYGKWRKDRNRWQAQTKGAVQQDPMNRFIHLVLKLNNGYQLALSDVRKFAKIELWPTRDLADSKEMKALGPDALSAELTPSLFKKLLLKKKGKIKQILMDQTVIAGIGNIYSDEILFRAKVHPQRSAQSLSNADFKKTHQAMRVILKKAIQLRGTSSSDYRDINGKKGAFVKLLKVYRRAGQKCPKCQGIIKRLKIGGRSAHYCPNCQK
ncbi:MAG: bifunctional DNA-formamidopyrimidine glycosylase/DNA-(apurinic or apyrimidinic site) lyase [Candidatus Pacebacteria bacterium]|nr:bifunctional DNA-formamidopyrimidine glycosylase/DNA-(apurinic or apyrimidinic site) lyase [Candidatus Paceibacterota bacterium]